MLIQRGGRGVRRDGGRAKFRRLFHIKNPDKTSWMSSSVDTQSRKAGGSARGNRHFAWRVA